MDNVPLPTLYVCMYLYVCECVCLCVYVSVMPMCVAVTVFVFAFVCFCIYVCTCITESLSGHVLVESVRADCLLVSCPGNSTWTATRSACCRRASLTSSRRFSEGARVAGGMGPWEFVGACVARCGA